MARTPKPRVNPHKPGTPEHTVFAGYRRAKLEADRLQADADRLSIEAGAHRAKAEHYAKALTALGHSPEGATFLIEHRPAFQVGNPA